MYRNVRNTIDGATLRKMILSAAASVENHKQQINELNVFPVPDGDTGTNMSMTLNAAADELRRAGEMSLTKAADKIASAMLRGARGNSGVILSLLFRGFAKTLKGMEECDGVSVDYLLCRTEERLTAKEYKEKDSYELAEFMSGHTITVGGVVVSPADKRRICDMATGLFWTRITGEEKK